MPAGIYKHRMGWKHSKETKRKIGLKSKGRNLGGHFSIEHRKKLSLARIGKSSGAKGRHWICLRRRKDPLKLQQWKTAILNRSGCNHWNWKGGITKKCFKIRHSMKFTRWRKKVFSKNNFTCQKTLKKGCILNAHHLYNFISHPELRFSVKNGITLSASSHREFHKLYGRKNNTPEQIIDYLNRQSPPSEAL